MKIHIENKSRLDIAQAARIVADLLRQEIDFMLSNTTRGCQFSFKGVTVAMYPVSKLHPAGEMAFLVMDEKNEGVKQTFKKFNCSRCGRFVGHDGKHDVFYDDWTGGYECGYPLCGKCLSKNKKKEAGK